MEPKLNLDSQRQESWSRVQELAPPVHHCPFTMIIIAQELRLELEEERKELCPGYKEETKPGPEERNEAEGTEV